MTKRLSSGDDFPALFEYINIKDESLLFNVTNPPHDEVHSKILQIPINELVPSPFQPRKNFDLVKLNELTESIRTEGILQPLLVRKCKNENRYEIIAGERRWRAAKEAGLSTVPVFIRDVDDKKARALALIENLQRDDLTPIDEAIAYQQLIEHHGISHQELAILLSKPRSTITNILRLLNLEKNVQKLLNDGQIEIGHAKVLLGISAEEQYTMAHLIIQKKLSVRELEMLIKNKLTATEDFESIVVMPQQSKINALTELLSEKLSFPFKFKVNPKGHGAALTIKFDDISQASQFIEKFKVEI